MQHPVQDNEPKVKVAAKAPTVDLNVVVLGLLLIGAAVVASGM